VTQFNPYQQWLGIDRAKPTYYHLLGVKPRETDTDFIRQQGEQLANRVRQLEVGNREALRQELLARIQRAVRCLTNEQQRAEYDQKLRSVIQKKRGKRLADAQSDSSDLPNTDIAVPQITLGAPGKGRRRVKRTRRQRQRRMLVLISGLILVPCTIGAVYQFVTRGGWLQPIESPPRTRPSSNVARPETRNPDRSHDALSADHSVASTPTPQPELASSPPSLSPSLSPSLLPAVTAADLARLSSLLRQARDSLTQRRTSKAREYIEQARSLAKRPGDHAKLARLERLTDYVDQYWQASADGTDQLSGGHELTLNGTRWIVVEVTSSTLVLRANGRNTTYDRTDLPLEIAIAMADRFLDPSAASTRVFRGAMMAVTAKYSAADAARLWQQAADMGIDLADLPQVLDDD
jgi:hypothetical protein